MAPGSPVDRFRNPRVTPEVLENLIRLYGLDKPLPEQFIRWVTSFVQVWNPDAWGRSFLDGQPVLGSVLHKLPATLELMGLSLILTVVLGDPIGVLAAVKQYSMMDKVISTLATIGYAIPSFILGALHPVPGRRHRRTRRTARASSRSSGATASARTATWATSSGTSRCP